MIPAPTTPERRHPAGSAIDQQAAAATVEPDAASEPGPDTSPARAAPGKHLRIAPDLAGRRRRARLVVWGATSVTCASLFALVAFHVLAVQQSFELDRLNEQRAAEARRYEQLRYEVAALSSPDAIVEAAMARGMEFASGRPQQVEAPLAAPTAPADAQTSDTLRDTHDGAKSSLGP